MTSTPAAGLIELLHERAFVRVWLVGVCRGTAQWLEMLVAGVFAFELTGSPFMVALLFIARLAPLTILGSLIGTFADRVSPRLILLTGFSFATLTSLAVSLVLGFGVPSYWVVLIASVASGIVWTTDMPVRRRIVGDVAGTRRIVPAMSFDSATNHATRMLGPLAGGIVYQALGPAGAYALTAGLYFVAVVLIFHLRAGEASKPATTAVPRLIGQIREGFAFSVGDRDVLRFLMVTIAFNVWGLPFITMIPVIGSEVLELSPAGVGALAALEGAGAFLGALSIAVARISFHQRRLYYFGTLFYVGLACLAGFMTDAPSMALVLALIGFSLAGFSAMQSTLVYAIAPPEMRSRLFGLLVICIGTGLLGVVNMGLMGEWLGGAGAVRLVAAEGIVAIALIGLGWRELRAER